MLPEESQNSAKLLLCPFHQLRRMKRKSLQRGSRDFSIGATTLSYHAGCVGWWNPMWLCKAYAMGSGCCTCCDWQAVNVRDAGHGDQVILKTRHAMHGERDLHGTLACMHACRGYPTLTTIFTSRPTVAAAHAATRCWQHVLGWRICKPWAMTCVRACLPVVLKGIAQRNSRAWWCCCGACKACHPKPGPNEAQACLVAKEACGAWCMGYSLHGLLAVWTATDLLQRNAELCNSSADQPPIFEPLTWSAEHPLNSLNCSIRRTPSLTQARTCWRRWTRPSRCRWARACCHPRTCWRP